MLLAKVKALYEKGLIKPLFYTPNDFILNLFVRLHYVFLIIMALNYLQARVFVQQSDSLYSDIGVYGIALIAFCALNIFGLSNVFTRLMVWLLAVFTFKGANGINMNVEVVFATVPPLFFIFSNLTSSLENLKGKENSFVSGYPNFLAGLLFTTYIFFGGGVTKLFDPQWVEGVGYYYTFALKWIRPSYLEFLQVNTPSILIYMNYIALAAEFIMLPLYLIPRTRKIAVVLCVLFAAQLFFPLIIHQIGSFALTYTAFIAAAFLPQTLFARSPVSKFIQKISFLAVFNKQAVQGVLTFISKIYVFNPASVRKAVYLVMVGYMMLLSVKCMWISTTLKYPNIGDNFAVISKDSFHSIVTLAHDIEIPINNPSDTTLHMKPAKFNLSHNLVRQAYHLATHLNKCTYYLFVNSLFTSVHNLGVNTYSIEVVYSDSTKHFPLQLFDNNGTSGPENLSFTSTRLLQVPMYRLSTRYYCSSALNLESHGKHLLRSKSLHGLINYAIHTVPNDKKNDIEKVNIYLISQRAPYRHDNVHGNETVPSTTLYAWYDRHTNKLHAPDKLAIRVYGTFLPFSDNYLVLKVNLPEEQISPRAKQAVEAFGKQVPRNASQ